MPVYSSCTCWTPCRVLWNRVCSSFHPAVCWFFFLGIGSLGFSEFWHDTRKPYRQIFWESFFCPPPLPKAGEMGKNSPKTGFLNLQKNLVINFPRICSIMKIYIIYCVPVQIFYLRKMLFLRYRPKCSQPFKLQDF